MGRRSLVVSKTHIKDYRLSKDLLFSKNWTATHKFIAISKEGFLGKRTTVGILVSFVFVIWKVVS